jgi:hypothetical protein
MSSWLSDPEVLMFQQLMTVAQFRGRDGAGVAMAPTTRNKEYGVVRTTGTADDLVHSATFENKLKEMIKASCLIGHARYPTQGGMTIADAHPVIAGHIIGVHNGTMKKVAGQTVTPTDHDTVMFYDSVCRIGIEETVKSSAGEYCFVWADKNDFSLNFLRNSKRPLYFGHYSDNTATIYWSSEPQMLYFVLGRRAGSKQEVIIRSLPEDTLYKFTLGTTKIKETKTIKPEAANSNGGPFVYTAPENRPLVPIIRQSQRTGSQTVVDAAFTSAIKPRGVPEAEVHVQYGPEKQYIATFPKLKGLLNAGCMVCSDPLDYNSDFKSGKVHFVNEDMAVCDACVKRDPTMYAILKQSAGRAIH